jgi:L,D-peptidoglycan transpeptidase YkuD (ErfK/YbiS/YcfS/YnhG family)
MRKFLIFLLFLFLGPVSAQDWSIPPTTRQLVVVCNESWDDTTGRMVRYQRTNQDGSWVQVGSPVPINLGRTGLAWGSSPLMSEPTSGLKKKEGDGRAPAGLFPILRAFGHPSPPKGYTERNLEFLNVTNEQCVDDAGSEYYNSIVNPSEVGGVTWDSAEKMKIGVYRLGLVIGHNCPKAVPGLGSCIFFHYETGPGVPTAGCTSMTPTSLKNLVLWLEKDSHPVLLQLPRPVFESLKGDYPEFPD